MKAENPILTSTAKVDAIGTIDRCLSIPELKSISKINIIELVVSGPELMLPRCIQSVGSNLKGENMAEKKIFLQ